MGSEIQWLRYERSNTVLVPVGLLVDWRGMEASERARSFNFESDYEMACFVHRRPVSPFPVGAGLGLVFGGAPRTGWCALSEVEGVVVGIEALDDDESSLLIPDLLASAQALGPATLYRVPEPDAVLFPAVDAGVAARTRGVSVVLRPGLYLVESRRYESDRANLVLHRLLRADPIP